MKFALSFPFVLTFLFLARPAWAQDTIALEIKYKGFNTFFIAVANAGLEEKLRAAGPFTVFAPTDDAFRNLPKAQLDALMADKEKLAAVLSHHIVEGKLALADLKPGKLKALDGKELDLQPGKEGVKIGTANIVKPNVKAANGVIHGIDAIQMP